MEPTNLLPMQKKLYDNVTNLLNESLGEGKTWTLEEIVNELKTNRKYRDYNRQPDKILSALIKRLFPQFSSGPTKEEKQENPYLDKLMNRKVKDKEQVQKADTGKDDMNELIEEEIKKKLKVDKDIPKIFFSDIGGIDDIINEIKELVLYPIKFGHFFTEIGVKAPKGILLSGPPGSGKTSLGLAICNEMARPYKKITGTEIVSSMSGESEGKIRTLFEEMKVQAPSILFIDEIDSIASKKDNTPKEMEKRILSQLFACLDEIADKDVFVIGATGKPESLDPGLRRSGRFDREISLAIPNEKARFEILERKTKNTKLDSVDLVALAKAIPGYVGADIEALIKESGITALKRLIGFYGEEQLEAFEEGVKQECKMNMLDFQIALKKVQPTAKREGFSVIPGTTWEDIGALKNLREELESSICWPITDPEKFKVFNINPPAGVLLYGPPGCGKTLLAKAVANESKANFISIKGPELLNKYVGESERAIRELFRRAKSSAPCVIFFDEIDAICPKRGSDANQVTERVVNQLLTELDGMEDRKNVFVIAATNRPDIIDSAMLRPGRLDKLLYVPIPTSGDRSSILTALTRKSPIAEDVNFEEIAQYERCEGYTGADLGSLVKEAAMIAMKRVDNDGRIHAKDFFEAFDKTAPSVSPKDKILYENLQKNLRNSKNMLA